MLTSHDLYNHFGLKYLLRWPLHRSQRNNNVERKPEHDAMHQIPDHHVLTEGAWAILTSDLVKAPVTKSGLALQHSMDSLHSIFDDQLTRFVSIVPPPTLSHW